MKAYRFSVRRPVGMLILLAALTGLLGGCARAQVNQGENSRIPDTSEQSTAVVQGNPLPIVTLSPQAALPAASPSLTLLPSQSSEMVAQSPSLNASPSSTPQPTKTATPQLSKVDPTCLIGTWQVADLPAAMSQSYAQSGSTLQLQGVEGQAEYVFDSNGSMKISFNQLSATFTGNIDQHDVTARQGLDGSGTAHYQVNPVEGQVVFTDFGGQGLLSTLDINGQRLAEGNIPVWRTFTSSLTDDNAAPASLIEYSRAAVTCQSKSMTIQAIEPLPGPVVTLNRK